MLEEVIDDNVAIPASEGAVSEGKSMGEIP